MSFSFGNGQPTAPQQGGGDLQVGSLERMGIFVETTIPQGVLTPATAKGIHFRTRKPSGYAFNEVDEFVLNIVQPAIDWYVNSLYQRDMHVHQLGQALDQAEIDVKNLKAQAQFLEYNGQIAKGLERGQDDAEMVAVMAKLTATESELNATKAELQAARAGGAVTQMIGGANPNGSKLDSSFFGGGTSSEPAQQGSPQVSPDSTGITAPPVVLTPQVEVPPLPFGSPTQQLGTDGVVTDAELQAKLEEQEAYIAQLMERYEQLQKMYEELVAQFDKAQAELAQRTQELVEKDNLLAAGQPVENGGAKPDAETEQYIKDFSDRYDQLQNMYEELSQRYSKEIADLEAQVAADKEDLAKLQEAAQQIQADEPQGLDAETQAYVDELLARYTALIEQYNEDTTDLQTKITELESGATQVAQMVPTNEEAEAEIQQLRDYYDQAVSQYNVLLDMYNQAVTQIEAGGGSVTIVQQEVAAAAESVDTSKFVAITEYERVVAENEALRQQLEEALGEDASTTADDYIPQFMLPAEDLKRDIDPAKYGNLPPGVTPGDLE